MAEILTAEEVAEIRKRLGKAGPRDIGNSRIIRKGQIRKLCDTAESLRKRAEELEEELTAIKREAGKAASLLNVAGPLSHRVRMYRTEYSRQITELEAENKAWAKWLVEGLRFPFEMQLPLNPPCTPMKLAEAWDAKYNDRDLCPEDYLNSMEIELGKEYMNIWNFNTVQLALRGEEAE